MKLDLSSNSISGSGGKALIESLSFNHTLAELNIGSFKGLYRNKIGVIGISPISQVLMKNESLVYLNVTGNQIGDEGLKYISNGLCMNEALLSLNVAQNEITSYGAFFINQAITCSNLRNINISRNNIGDEGILHFSEIFTGRT